MVRLLKTHLVNLIAKIGEKLLSEEQIFLIALMVVIFFMFILQLKKISVKLSR